MFTEDTSISLNRKKHFIGSYIMSAERARNISFFGTIIALIALSLFLGVDYKKLFFEFSTFISGNPFAVQAGTDNLLEIIKTSLGVIAAHMAVVIMSMYLINHFLGAAESVFDDIAMAGTDSYIPKLLLLNFAEEALARWLALGILTKIFPGAAAFYFFLILGNSIWSYIHLKNFIHKKDRLLIRVLPQFIIGLFYSYIFVKYGLLASTLVHITCNMTLFAIAKADDVYKKDIYRALYYLAYFILSLLGLKYLGISLTDIKPWFTSSAILPLSNYGFWHYLFVFLAFNSLMALITEALLYDNYVDSNIKKANFIALVVLAVVLVAIIYLINWVLGFFIDSHILRFAIIVIIFTLAESGSAQSAAGTWFGSLVTIYIFICIAMVAGFWVTCGILVIGILLSYVPKQLSDTL
jgi:hypothetical protein